MKLSSLKIAYFAWVLLTVMTASHGFVTGEHHSQISTKVSKAGNVLPQGTDQKMWHRLIVISLAAAISVIGVVGALVWQTLKRKKWAAWTLTILACWQVYNYAIGIFPPRRIPTEIFGIPNWLLDATGALLWLYVIFAIFYAARLKTESAAVPNAR